MFRRWLVVVLVGGCGTAQPGATAAPITNGAADPGDPAVAALLGVDGSVACSGTLVAPHTVLTAAHCRIGPDNFDAYTVSFGAMATAAGALPLTDARVHPAFDAATFANDLALLTLLPVGPATPIALDARTVDATFVGQTFAAVGFGTSAPGAGDSGTRRSGTAMVTAVGTLDFTSVPSPSQPCGGDSGGPALFADGAATVLTGVTSHGDTACADHAVFARVDVAQADFIQPYLASIAAGSASTGDRCYFDEQCAGGPCLQATDEPKRFWCAQPCRTRGDCPAAMVCAADGCRYPVPSPGALGATCAQASDCVSGICNVGACTRACVPTGMDCPAGYECSNAGGISFYCRRVPASGCDVGRGEPSAPLALALALCLVAAAARGSRARAARCR